MNSLLSALCFQHDVTPWNFPLFPGPGSPGERLAHCVCVQHGHVAAGMHGHTAAGMHEEAGE